MRKIKSINTEERMCLTREEFRAQLGCGIATADRIAKEAKAKLRVGKRVLIYLPKIEAYFRDNTGGDF